jgi:hypothetical protein
MSPSTSYRSATCCTWAKMACICGQKGFLSVHLPARLPAYLSICLPICLSTCLSDTVHCLLQLTYHYQSHGGVMSDAKVSYAASMISAASQGFSYITEQMGKLTGGLSPPKETADKTHSRVNIPESLLLLLHWKVGFCSKLKSQTFQGLFPLLIFRELVTRYIITTTFFFYHYPSADRQTDSHITYPCYICFRLTLRKRLMVKLLCLILNHIKANPFRQCHSTLGTPLSLCMINSKL